MFQSLLIYSLSFSLSLGLSKYYSIKSKNNDYKLSSFQKHLWILAIIFPVVFISTFRYNVGTDFFNYINIFSYVNQVPLSLSLTNYTYSNEPLFILLNKFSGIIFQNYKGILFLSSFTIYFLITKTLMFFEKDVSLSFGLFISYMFHFSMGLNVIRQMIAAAIVFYSLIYIYKKNFLKYIFTILIATMFHNSAIVCLIFYLFTDWSKKINGKNIKNMILVFYTILIIFSPFIIFISLNLVTEIPIFSQYKIFISSSFDLGLGALFIVLLYLLPTIFYKNNIFDLNVRYEAFYYLALLNIPFRYLSYFSGIGSRLTMYSEIILYISIPLTISSIKQKNDRIIIAIYFIVVIGLRYVQQVVLLNSGETYPYIFNF